MRFSTTHHPLKWSEQQASDLSAESVVGAYANQKAILLIRNPLDVMASAYRQQTKGVTTPERFHGDFLEFCNDPIFGLEKMARFYRIWLDFGLARRGQVASEPDNGAALLVKYEDLLAKPDTTLRGIITFVGAPWKESCGTRAIEATSIDRLREMEKRRSEPTYGSSGFPMFGDRSQRDADYKFIGDGGTGSYSELLNPKQCHELEQRVVDLFPRELDYPV